MHIATMDPVKSTATIFWYTFEKRLSKLEKKIDKGDVRNFICTTLNYTLCKLNSFTSVCISMNSISCCEMCDSDFLAMPLSLIESIAEIMSLANEMANMKIPNASVIKHAKYRQTNKHGTYWHHTVKKYPIGFFHSNGNLSNLQIENEKKIIEIIIN